MINKYKKYKNKINNKIFNFVSLKTSQKKIGNVLISYITDPFLLTEEEINNNHYHTNVWECFSMANTFLNLGYNVDIIKWDNYKFIPKKNYKVFIDIHNNAERLSKYLNKDCIKINHITTAHWLFQNKAEYKRLQKLKERKGIVLKPKRTLEPSFNLEYSDCAIILGNEFTINTYKYANKKIYQIPISTTKTFSSPKNKNFNKSRKNFIWFGGGGAVHKGLDLVLETFISMPDYNLTVCGPIKAEKDFETAYFKELYKTKNIKTIGRININSNDFKKIINTNIGLIYPSCSEGQSGSVVTCMHAGLIPAISYQSGVDVKDFGVILNKCSTEEIKNSIKTISDLPTKELKIKAVKAWEYANKKHTRENFNITYKKIINKILYEKNKRNH